MQSFRERSGFHGNQHCYQQEPQELSRLESYRQHHSLSRQSYESQSLSAAGMPTAGASSKDCYGQQTYPVYISPIASQTKKPYRGAKTPNQHMQAGYGTQMDSGYTAQYMSEGHLHQKWDESAQMSQFEQDMGRLESGVSGSSQYIEQNMLAISQSQCHLPSQSPAPVYTSPHQQSLPPNPAQSPLMYSQGHLHFPQHSQPPPSSTSYLDKCNALPHSYKGYGLPSNTQYGRQLSNHGSLKQSGYRPSNNYGYQQTPPRSGFEGSLQGMSGTQENVQKYQHYNQPQQNYCLTDISVRSPEQYYQTCSPSSSHSPARSVGRSPSYNSTPSPLMPNPESFQYSQSPLNPGTSSSTGLQEQNMLMPPQTHSSPSVNHQSQNYSGSMKERFSEKLLSNPSLWSLNALTSQVENISNNVQQLLLSEAMMANKKANKRNTPKKGEDYRGHIKSADDSSCPENQQGPIQSDSYSISRSMAAELQEGGYSSSTEDQMERSYYFFGPDKVQGHTQTQSRLSLDTVSTCSLNSVDDISVRSGDSVRSLQSVNSEDNVNCHPRAQRVLTEEEPNSSLHCITDERSPISVTAPSPMKQESNSPPDIKHSEITVKENFEESAWTERMADDEEMEQRKLSVEQVCKGEVIEKQQQKWQQDEKSVFHKISKAELQNNYICETEAIIKTGQEKKFESIKEHSSDIGAFSANHKTNKNAEIKFENVKTEPQSDYETLIKTSPSSSRTNEYLPEPDENSKNENVVQNITHSKQPTDALEEKQTVPTYNSTEIKDKKECFTTSEEIINNRTIPPSINEGFGTIAQTGTIEVVNRETSESIREDTLHRGGERRSRICDIAPQHHPAKSGFSPHNEKTTPLVQARDHHIDRSDAKVLEPDSPQLPGKSILHSSPSWADTPPSPKKGDEDMEAGISCPSAVTPSAKPEPLAPTAQTRTYAKKHARGRRRLVQPNVAITGKLSVEVDSGPPSDQNITMTANENTIIPVQMETAHQNITSQTPKLVTETLPSRMCTRSYGSQSNAKVCNQERRKSSPKTGSKPGPKPKLGQKPGPKPELKADSKARPKNGRKTKSEAVLDAKSGTKQAPHFAGPLEIAKPGPKPGSKIGSKLIDSPEDKNLPQSNESITKSLSTERLITKGPGRPRGLTSKIKLVKQKKKIQIQTEHNTDLQSSNEFSLNDVTTSLTLDSVVGVIETSKEETLGSTLKPTEISSLVTCLAKDQKSMVLRSRKQAKVKCIEQKEQEVGKSNEAHSHEPLNSELQNFTDAQSCGTKSMNFELPKQEDIFTDSLQQPNDGIMSFKRKSKLLSSDVKKSKKVMKEDEREILEPLEMVTGVCIAKRKQKRGYNSNGDPGSTTVIHNSSLSDDISDVPSIPPQCPTKTKYLPPRKGRGLKYEAMVQKITSPGSKKQPLNNHPDTLLEEATTKPIPQVPEQTDSVNAPEEAHEEGKSTMSTQETQDTAGIQNPRKKKRKWATVESSKAADIALEPGSLVINTPRLAKQKAIKNNHEMHLKQRKRRKKGNESQESNSNVEQVESAQTEILSQDLSNPSLPETNAPIQYKKTAKTCSVEKPKRGRRPSLKKKQGDPTCEIGVKVKEKKKPGQKKKDLKMNVIKFVVKRCDLKPKCAKHLPPTVKGTLSDMPLEQGEGTCFFKPYIHLDSSLEVPSQCTIVNRPEEEKTLVQERKKSATKLKSLAAVSKAVPQSSVMLQGPLVNKSIIDRCLTCCLCGKPANYRELGDLCGPYYLEDCIPRKMLSSTHRNDFKQKSNCAKETEVSCGTGEINAQSTCEKTFHQEVKNEPRSRHPRRGTRGTREHLGLRPPLRMRFKKLLLLQRRLGETSVVSDEEAGGSALQRLQTEAEAEEHWAHEACAVWTRGIILVAGKLFGLKEAVQNAENSKCSRCQSERASICCSWKSCPQRYHYFCAREMGCSFQEQTFSIRCPKHKGM